VILTVILVVGVAGGADARRAAHAVALSGSSRAGTGGAQPATAMTYHGGRVMRANRAYAIFWEPPFLQTGDPAYVSPTYNSLIKRYFRDVGGSGLYENNTQYYEVRNAQQKFIANHATLGGVFVDRSPYPPSGCNNPRTPGNCLSDPQIQAEVAHAMEVEGWKATPTHLFFVFTAAGEGSCHPSFGCSFANWAGYHSFFPDRTVAYANQPYGGAGYGVPGNPNNDQAADATINIVSHEQMEAVTDPFYDAWYQGSIGGEIGDLCIFNFGPLDEANGQANQRWNGHYYLVQQEWSNRQGRCVQDGP
jgi:hypothetical protein